MGRFLLALLPLTTLIVVGVLVLWIGAPRSVAVLRIWGGPTDRLPRFSGWVEAEVEGRPLSGAKLRLSARPAQGKAAAAAVTLDADGRAELLFEFGSAPHAFELTAEGASGVLGQGRVALAAQRWLGRAGRRGGFSRVPPTGVLTLQMAPARGALAVPFPGEMWVRVTRDGAPAPGAKVQLKSDGARLASEFAESDSQGMARFTLTPGEHVVTARVNAVAPDGARGELFSSVPVVPGAIWVEPLGASLRIRSPVERASAFIALVTEQGRWFGAKVTLSAVGDGTAMGVLALPDMPAEPSWAVAKSEPTAPSTGCVGWPLFESAEPALTLDVPDALLLDTAPAARAREHERRLGIRRLALAVGLFGALISVLFLVWATLRQRKQLGSHLSAELGAEQSAQLLPAESFRSLFAISLIVLGFIVVVAIFAWRLV